MIFISNQTRKATLKPKKQYETTINMERRTEITKETDTETTEKVNFPEVDDKESMSAETVTASSETQEEEYSGRSLTSDASSTNIAKEEEEDKNIKTTVSESSTYKQNSIFTGSVEKTTTLMPVESVNNLTQSSTAVPSDLTSSKQNLNDLAKDVSSTAGIDVDFNASTAKSKSTSEMNLETFSTMSPEMKTVSPVPKLSKDSENDVSFDTDNPQVTENAESTPADITQEPTTSAPVDTLKETSEKNIASTRNVLNRETLKISTSADMTTSTPILSKQEIDGEVTSIDLLTSSDERTYPETESVTSNISNEADSVTSSNIGDPIPTTMQRNGKLVSPTATPDKKSNTEYTTESKEETKFPESKTETSAQPLDNDFSTTSTIKSNFAVDNKLKDIEGGKSSTEVQDTSPGTTPKSSEKPSFNFDGQTTSTIAPKEEFKTTTSETNNEYSKSSNGASLTTDAADENANVNLQKATTLKTFTEMTTAFPQLEEGTIPAEINVKENTTRPRNVTTKTTIDIVSTEANKTKSFAQSNTTQLSTFTSTKSSFTEEKLNEKKNGMATSTDIAAVENATLKSSDLVDATNTSSTTSPIPIGSMNGVTKLDTTVNVTVGFTPSSKTAVKKLIEDSTTKSIELSTGSTEKKNEPANDTTITTQKSVPVSATSQWRQSTSVSMTQRNFEMGSSSTASNFVTVTAPSELYSPNNILLLQ